MYWDIWAPFLAFVSGWGFLEEGQGLPRASLSEVARLFPSKPEQELSDGIKNV